MINNYIRSINKRFKTGIATEHTYRSDLQILLESLSDDVLVTKNHLGVLYRRLSACQKMVKRQIWAGVDG